MAELVLLSVAVELVVTTLQVETVVMVLFFWIIQGAMVVGLQPAPQALYLPQFLHLRL